MQVEIDDKVVARLRELVPVRLTDEDITFFTDCLTWIGIAMVNSSLQKYPDLTFGELLTMFFKNQHH
jgi:hypothetical protein